VNVVVDRAIRAKDNSVKAANSPSVAPKGFVCMIAYTNYVTDARVRREAETLAAAGYHVRCLTTRNGDSATQMTVDGVELCELDVPKYRGKSTLEYTASYLRFLIYASITSFRLLLKREVDVVHVHNLPDFLVFAGLVPRLMGRRVVLDVHDSVPETFATKFSSSPFLHRVLCLEEKVSAFVAHRVICVNQPQRDTLVARGIPSEKTFISMNVPDPKIFGKSMEAETGPPEETTFNLVYHGTMVERLGVDLVIRAVARLRQRDLGVHLHLWGHGDDLENFQQLARQLDLEDRVLFSPKGYPLQELPHRLRTMHLGVVGNRRSVAGDLMLPVKMLEYISLGIPVVVPKLRTIQHYFPDDMVFYYEPEDVESLADCLHRLRCQPDVRRAKALRAHSFLQQHGWEHQGAELVALYQTLVERERK
jgi:glycosyltransferase involved in cell wall biosynthesis